MKNFLRNFLLHLAGQFSQHLIAIATLLGLAYALKLPVLYVTIMSVTLIAGRVIIRLSRKTKPVFEEILIRKQLRWLIEDELRIMLLFFAVAFLLRWPLSATAGLVLLVSNIVGQLLGLGMTRQLLMYLKYDFNQPGNRKKVIVVGTGRKAKQVVNKLLDAPESDTEIVGLMDFKRKGLWRYRDIPLIGHPRQLSDIALESQIDGIVIAVENEDIIFAEQLLEQAEELGLTVCEYTVSFNPKGYQYRPGYVAGLPMMIYRRVPDHLLKLLIKSTLDKIVAGIALLSISPILLFIAIAIKIDSKGPVLFKQIRSGLNGKPFALFKFRTMGVGADKLKEQLQAQNEMSGPVCKITNDPRVTKVGRILRKTSLDELPQLLNVVRGEMSLVGPRPPLPKEVKEYKYWQHRRLSVKPGITCTWQVSGRNQIDFEDWMKLDLDYIDNWSLWNDTKIIARTFPAVLKGDGAS